MELTYLNKISICKAFTIAGLLLFTPFCIQAQTEDETDLDQIILEEEILVEITSLGKMVNKPLNEYAPVITADAKVMYFTRLEPLPKGTKVTGKKSDMENIYMTKQRRGKWGTPRKLTKPINQRDHNNSALALSNDGQRMFLFREEQDPETGQFQGDIWESKAKGRRWLEPVKLPEPVNSTAHESSACFSYDGRTIYLVSEREGGLGGKDIYTVTKDDSGKWGEAINLGETINTEEDEESVFAHADGRTLYFSSKGHNTIGGHDIFKSELQENGEWGTPINIKPLNSKGDDKFFVLAADGEHGYYSAVRKEGLGGYDLYKVTFIQKPKSYVTILKGVIKNDSTGAAVEAKLEIVDNEKNETVAVFNSNSVTGEYLVCLPYGRNYGISVSAEGYLFHSENINLARTASLGKKSKLHLLTAEGEKITTVNVDKNGFFIFKKLPYEQDAAFTLDLDGTENLAEIQIIVMDKNGKEKIISAFRDSNNVFQYKYLEAAGGDALSLIEEEEKKLEATTGATVGYQEIVKDIGLKKVIIGAKIVLNNIFFDYDKATLRHESTAELERLTDLMNKNENLRIEISGHTDNLGSDEYNQKLSERRSKAVVDYIIGKGVDQERMTYAGYGEAQPIETNDTDEGRQMNRRTEFKILEN